MSTSTERLDAARILVRVEDGAYASRILSVRPAPGVRARVQAALRWMRLVDAAVKPYLKAGIDALDPELRAVLRLGLVETMVLGVPAPVATSAAVELVRRLGKGSAAGLVNAVLRRAQVKLRDLAENATPGLRLSHPEWLWQRWRAHFGEDVACGAMEANQQPASTWVWALDPALPGRLSSGGHELVAHPWCQGAFRTVGDVAALMAEVRAGAAYVQDPASQLVALIAARLTVPGGRVVDLCAAPGGKAALLQRRVEVSGFCAADLQLRRAALMRPLLAAGGGAVVLVADAKTPPFVQHGCDLVLVDAPCSGTGTLRRHPELKWRLAAADIAERAALQRSILTGALPLVAPGGVLLYSTCSVEPEENEAHFAALPAHFDRLDLARLLPECAPGCETPARGVRLMPATDCDGFTIHALRRM